MSHNHNCGVPASLRRCRWCLRRPIPRTPCPRHRNLAITGSWFSLLAQHRFDSQSTMSPLSFHLGATIKPSSHAARPATQVPLAVNWNAQVLLPGRRPINPIPLFEVCRRKDPVMILACLIFYGPGPASSPDPPGWRSRTIGIWPLSSGHSDLHEMLLVLVL
jgi:hypothetical protein